MQKTTKPIGYKYFYNTLKHYKSPHFLKNKNLKKYTNSITESPWRPPENCILMKIKINRLHLLICFHYNKMENNENTSLTGSFKIFGKRVRKPELTFITQVIILYIVIIKCIINLSLKNGTSELWVSMLSYSLGCLLPSPKIKKLNLNNDNTSNMERVSEKDIL